MTAVAQKTVLNRLPCANDKDGLRRLIITSKANPKVIKTLKCRDDRAKSDFRHANYIRDLPPYIINEAAGPARRRRRADPSEASLAALGSCLAVGLHARRGASRLDRERARAAARRRPRRISGMGHQRRQRRKPSASPTCGSRSTWSAEGRCPGGDRRARDPRQEVVADPRRHVHPAGESRGRRVETASVQSLPSRPGTESVMGGVGCIASAGRRCRRPFAGVRRRRGGGDCAQGRVSARSRPASTKARVYPADLRRLGDAGAWATHRAGRWRGRCAAPYSRISAMAKSAAPPLHRECRNALHLVRDQFRQSGADGARRRRLHGEGVLGGTGLSIR